MASPLKRKHGDRGEAQPVNPPKRLRSSVPLQNSSEADSQKSWEVERIHDQRGEEYLLEWKGVDEQGEPWSWDWVHRDRLGCPDLIAAWEASHHQRYQDLQALRTSHPEPSLTRSTPPTPSGRGKNNIVSRRQNPTSSPLEIQETLEEQVSSILSSQQGQSLRSISGIDSVGDSIKAVGLNVSAHTQTSRSSRSLNRQDSTLGSSVEGSPGLPVQTSEVEVEQSSSLNSSWQFIPNAGSIERITSSRSIRFPKTQDQQPATGRSQTKQLTASASTKDNEPTSLFFNEADDLELAREQNTSGLTDLVGETDLPGLPLSYTPQPITNSNENDSQEIPTSYQPVTQIQTSPVEPVPSADPLHSHLLPPFVVRPKVASSPTSPIALSTPSAWLTVDPTSSTDRFSSQDSILFSQPSNSIMASNTKLRNQLHALRASSRAQSSPLSKNASPAPSTPRSPLTRLQRLNSPEKETEINALAVQDQPVPSLEPPESPIRSERRMDVDEPGPEPEEMARPEEFKASIEPTMLRLPRLNAREYVVPLPIDSRMKDQYMAEMHVRAKDITAYAEDPTSTRLIEAMQIMISKLNDTLIHLDMGLDVAASQCGSTQEEAGYSEASSMKFSLLDHLIRLLAVRGATIAILARGASVQSGSAPIPGKRHVTDLIYGYLRGKGVECALISSGDTIHKPSAGETGYYILSTQNDLSLLPRQTSLIIAFDDSLKVADLPDWSSNLPVLLPWIVFSPEHIARCIPASLEPSERLRRQVDAVVSHRFSLGEWESQQLLAVDPSARTALMKRDFLYRVENAAAIIVNALSTDSFGKPLFSIPELEVNFPSQIPPSSSVAEPVSRAGTPSGQKRLRDDPASVGQSKRQRLTPLADISHITDSLKGTQSPSLQALLKTSQTALANERAAHQRTQASLDQLVLDHRSLQDRYEKRRRSAHGHSKRHLEQTNTLEALETRHKSLQETQTTLKDALRTTTSNLASARADLIASPNPDKAGLASAREAARIAETETETLQNRLKSRDNEFEFLRAQYQKASTAALENAAQVAELETAVAELQADINPVADEKNPPFLPSRTDFANLSAAAAHQADLARVEELETELATMRGAWERAEEELLVLRRMRGGVVTRGGSAQPQFAGVGAGSRGASPLTGSGVGDGRAGGNNSGNGAGWRPGILRDER